MENEKRTPQNYFPTNTDLQYLISESPRGRLILEAFWEGHATVDELASVIWPDCSNDELSEAKKELYLRLEDGSHPSRCTFKKIDNDYCVIRYPENKKERPYGLPTWSKK